MKQFEATKNNPMTWESHEPGSDKSFPPVRTFEAHGKVWIEHVPGNPGPVDGESLIFVISKDEKPSLYTMAANVFRWSRINSHTDLIGWRYADDAAMPTAEVSGPTDTELLDWLELKGLSLSCEENEGGLFEWETYAELIVRKISSGKTAREAIAAAMKLDSTPSPGQTSEV